MDEEMRPPGAVTSVEAAEILGTNLKYVYYLSDRGALKFRKVGFTRWYDRAEVEEYKRTHPMLGKNRKHIA